MLPPKSLLNKVSRDFTPNEMCDFVLTRLFLGEQSLFSEKSLFKAKSHILFGVKSHETLLNRLFGGSIHYFSAKSLFKQTFWGEHLLFLWKKPG